nr:MAG: ORF1 [TTV-like mini virus]
MVYYYRNYRRPWWKRRRRLYWRRLRRPFRNYRRRRRQRVRKRKLKFLQLKQWQPGCIRKLCIKGLYCLWQANHRLLTNNYTQYMESIPPEGIPSGGGFSINRFNIDCLYSEHKKARNVWTKGNKNLPMIRYLGCEYKIYRPKHCDAVIKFQNCYPMEATDLTYFSSQPYIMMMTKGTKKIKRLDDTKNKKPYKIFKLKPPQQMTNRWFFTADIYKTGLNMITATAADFNNIYISPYAESDTITLKLLNTKLFQNTHFNGNITTGYHPQEGKWLWAASNGNTPPLFKEMIYLGNTTSYALGTEIQHLEGYQNTKTLTELAAILLNKQSNWGNPFHENYLEGKHRLYYTTKSPAIAFQGYTGKKGDTPITQIGFYTLDQELYFTGRYNPNRDRATQNTVYFVKNTEEGTWDIPQKASLITQGYPLWVTVWGLRDYHEKLKDMQHMDTDYMMCIQTKYIEPQDIQMKYYVLLDKEFINGDSEWHGGEHRTPWDNVHWYPMLHYQHRSIENIGQSGPAVPKLGPYKTEELHTEYKFYFKVGGCIPPMEEITDPAEQTPFPIPTNITDSNSLQSPAENIQNYLYTFDERRGLITKTAADRITKDYSTTKTLFTDPETSGTDVPILQTLQEIEDSEEEEETQETTLFQQLINQRNKQLRIRKRIKQLLTSLQHTT